MEPRIMPTHTDSSSHLTEASRSEASLYGAADAEGVDGTCRQRSTCDLEHWAQQASLSEERRSPLPAS